MKNNTIAKMISIAAITVLGAMSSAFAAESYTFVGKNKQGQYLTPNGDKLTFAFMTETDTSPDILWTSFYVTYDVTDKNEFTLTKGKIYIGKDAASVYLPEDEASANRAQLAMKRIKLLLDTATPECPVEVHPYSIAASAESELPGYYNEVVANAQKCK